MRNWERTFDGRILARGKEYLKSGKVKGFIQNGDSCMARVLGTHVYNVSITGVEADFPRMICDCLFAKGGMHCKHEAAVMYHYEKVNKIADTGGFDSGIDHIADLKSNKGKTYFNVEPFFEENLVGDEKFEEAKELITSGKITLDRHRLVYLSSSKEEQYLALDVEGKLSGNRDYPVTVRLLFSKDRILTADCYGTHYGGGYYSYYGYSSLCVHQVALLLLADEYIARYNPGDDTDYLGDTILKNYRRLVSIQKIDDTVEKKNIISLTPKLTLSESGAKRNLFVSFRIGIEKLYALKNISEFIQKKESAEALKLGKNTIISFMENDFDEQSQKYYGLIEKAKADADFIQKKVGEVSSYYMTKINFLGRDKIELSPELLDMFYEAASGKRIDYGNGKAALRVCDAAIKCIVELDKLEDKDGKSKGLKVRASLPVLFKGKDYDYLLDSEKGMLARVKEPSPVVRMLVDSAKGADMVEFSIGQKYLSEFYYRLLPQMMESPEIEVMEKDKNLQSVLPPECQLTFYMDANEDDIFGRVSARYDEEEVFIHELRDEDYPLPEGRDYGYEHEALETLRKYLPETDSKGEYFFCERTGESTFNVLSEGLKDMMAFGEIKASKDFERLKIRSTPVIRLGVSVESGILNLDISTDDMSEAELLELLDSYRKKKKFFRLRNGEFIRLDHDDALEELVATMQAMGVSAKEFTKGKLHLPLYRAIYINNLLEEHDEIASDRDKNFKGLIRNFNSVRESDVEVPKSLAKTLRGYQAYGFKWLTMLSDLGFGGILADDMGLGKTLQVIALLVGKHEDAKKEKKSLHSLVVCPASLVYNWEEEFKRFAPDINVRTVTGTQVERKKLLSSKKLPEVLVTSYDLLKRDIGNYESLNFDYEIIDEAQFIKNASAAASKAVKIINAIHRFALTGTPIENRLSELWSIFDYLMPGFLYTYDRFKSDFEMAITKHKDEETTRQLKNMVGPFILRRLKENVLKDLPDKMEEIRYSRFDPAQRKLYDAQVTHMKRLLESEDYKSGKDRMKVLSELTRIRQICCDPELITAGYKGESAKRTSCIELVQSAIDGGHKILLFSQFTSMFELLEKDFKELGIEYYKITGQTQKEERIKLVHAFNENEVPLFLISLKAGGTGLNLVGADVVIHYDPWWNLAAQNQATDRAHRIGQTRKVSVFKLIAKDTIEEKIIEMQNAKRDLADAILSGESESLMNMSKEQLMELLG